MDATRGLVKEFDGRPVYVYLVHVSMQDEVHRLCRSGCAPVLAAAYATTDTRAARDAAHFRRVYELLAALFTLLSLDELWPRAAAVGSGAGGTADAGGGRRRPRGEVHQSLTLDLRWDMQQCRASTAASLHVRERRTCVRVMR